LSWALFKHISEKIWVWFKVYWYIPALVAYTLAMAIIFRRNDGNVLRVLEVSKDSYKKQIAVLNKTHTEELEKRDEIIRRYNKVIEQVEAGYEEANKQLDKHKKKRIKKLIEEHHDTPEHLTQLLSLTFGIHYEEG